MKEQFDKKLAEKIKDSFANHQEPFDPKQWEKFSATYFRSKAPRKKFAWIWWTSGIAASLLIGILLLSPFNDIDQFNQEVISLLEDEKISEQSEESSSKEEISIFDNSENDIGKNRGEANKERASQSEDLATERNSSVAKNQTESSRNVAQNQNLSKESVNDPKSDSSISSILPTKIDENKSFITENIQEKGNSTPALAEKEKVEKPKSLISEFELKNALLADEQEAQKMIDAWLKEDLTDSDKEVKSKDLDKVMRLGVILAPQTISSNTQAMNLGAGLMSEFSFSKRLKLDVGLAYAQQSINPNVNQEVRATSSMDSPIGDFRTASFSNNFVNATYELSFGQLEIPLNLKYKIIENKDSDFYLITGVSNMVYLNQKNVGTFTSANFANNGLMLNQQAVQTFTETVTPSSTDDGGDVNVGQMVNLSLGYEYNLKNGTFISVEPFYKLSVGGQTFVNQQFAIGGLNLRMNFQIKK
ncbi:outer membrane beta-barrel protein [Belliella aquatica]|uniref:Outer membrane protein beta-barrel domain-containing protein n=1 Tax=Belliella aquatica TaxID=1323734 RepID=A0ABQ1ML99_9BACT|nr:outer membrane beta-barrel protein [Belliella aquatica]MCH7405359.1 PorT family protein [Belliella aquatica]GGC42239.1 hypothetical protein GCM10010993_21060 [Belliella aquatica]